MGHCCIAPAAVGGDVQHLLSSANHMKNLHLFGALTLNLHLLETRCM
jgi:hypothetical protein